MTVLKRFALGALIGGAVVLLVAGPAAAVMTSNPTPCSASGVIIDKTGKVVSNGNQDSVEVKVPREGEVTWQGSVGTRAKSYVGKIYLDLGVFKYTPRSWRFAGGPQRDLANHGVEKIPNFIKYVPPGKYKVKGYRTGDGVTCAGYVTIELEGSPFSNPTGIGVMALTLVSLLGLLRAGVIKP